MRRKGEGLTVASWWRPVPALVDVAHQPGAADHLVPGLAGVLHVRQVRHGAVHQLVVAVLDLGGVAALYAWEKYQRVTFESEFAPKFQESMSSSLFS